MYEIIDDNETIYSGHKEDMINIFDKIKDNKIYLEWKGDLRLIKIIDITK